MASKKLIGALLGALTFGGHLVPAQADDAPAPTPDKKESKKKGKGEKKEGGEKGCGGAGGCGGDKGCGAKP